MTRILEQLLRIAQLDHLPEVHHHHPVAHVTYDVEIVADEDIGQPKGFLEIEKQVENLGLDGFVECRDRFVENDQARLQCQRARDVDALALPSGQLMRIALGKAPRLQTDASEQVARTLNRFAARGAVDLRCEGNRVLDGQSRIE